VSLSVEQLKAARKLLGWSRSELSHKSDVEYGRIENFELGLRTLSPDADAALMARLKRRASNSTGEFSRA
jgi:transcriptional regulator with XRE-family HTH domain